MDNYTYFNVNINIMKKFSRKVLFILLFIILIPSSLLLLILYHLNKNNYERKTLILGKTEFTVEIADSTVKQSLGLSFRKNLPKNQGMLFIFSTASRYAFWMKDMNFPLDFVWIKNNTVVDITENVPPPTSSGPLKIYRPKVPADKVLELNEGVISKKKIKLGDIIKLI